MADERELTYQRMSSCRSFTLERRIHQHTLILTYKLWSNPWLPTDPMAHGAGERLRNLVKEMNNFLDVSCLCAANVLVNIIP